MTFRNLLLEGRAVDLTVADGRIAALAPTGDDTAGMRPRPVVPAFYNCHTHLAMNLLRGYADDRALSPSSATRAPSSWRTRRAT